MNRPAHHCATVQPIDTPLLPMVVAVLFLSASLAAIAQAQTTTPAVPTAPPATSSVAATVPAATSTATTSRTLPPAAQPPTGEPLSRAEQTRVVNLGANISNQIEATEARLIDIADRLEQRLQILAAENIDMSTSTNALIDARSHLNATRATLRTIDADIYVVATAANPSEAWPAVRAQYELAQQNLRAAARALNKAVTAARSAAE